MDNLDQKKEKDWFIWIVLLSCLIVVAYSFFYLFFKKDFSFIVETSCDSTREECFSRDCSNPDNCPPNGLSNFKRYSLKASDFKYCQNEDCTGVCETGEIKCEPIKCSENVDLGESCLSVNGEQENSGV